jgi:uncharacterized membrane protein
MEEHMTLAQIIHTILYVHPPHTEFVHFPIALISAGLFFILLALIFKKDILEQIAFADLALGAVSTLVTGIVGIRDNLVLYHGQAANHNLKIFLGVTLFVIASVVAIYRWKKPELFHNNLKIIYVISYFVSFALVAVLGFLGGVIVFGT